MWVSASDSGPVIRLRSARLRDGTSPRTGEGRRLPHVAFQLARIHLCGPFSRAHAPGMLPASRGACSLPEPHRGPGGVDPRKMTRGTARRQAQPVLSVRASVFGRRGAFRRAVQRLSRRRAALCPWFVPPRLRPGFRGAFRVNRSIRASGGPARPTVSELLAGTRSGPGRSPGAARVRGLRDHARGRRPAPHEPAQPVRAPHGERAAWNMVLEYGGIMS